MRRLSHFLPGHDRTSGPVNPREAREVWEREKTERLANSWKLQPRRARTVAEVEAMPPAKRPPVYMPTDKTRAKQKTRITLATIHWGEGKGPDDGTS